MINFDLQAPEYNDKLLIGTGSFGTVRLESSSNKHFIVKRQKFKEIKKSTKIQQKWKMNANKEDIAQAIFEYCFYKICSLYKIGPAVDTEIGFDILCYKNHIEFHLQFCDTIYQVTKFRNEFKYEQFERQMKENLKLMHELKLIHKDIKPENMLYSNQYKRYVLTDFGLSHSVEQNVGQKSKTFFEGTRNYMSKQMEDLYKTNKLGTIDLYDNDRHAMRKSFKQILKILIGVYIQKKKQKSQEKKSLEEQIYEDKKQKSKNIFIKANNQQDEIQIYGKFQQNLTRQNKYQSQDINSNHMQSQYHMQSQQIYSQSNKETSIYRKDSYSEYQQQYQSFKKQFGLIEKQYLESVDKKIQSKQSSFTSKSKGYYEYLKLKFIAIKSNFSFYNNQQSWDSLRQGQRLDILNIVLDSSDLNKKKQVYDIRKNIAANQEQKNILKDIKYIIDQKEIPIIKSNLDKITQFKLRNYIRIYGWESETIKLCEQLQTNSKDKYLQLLQKMRYRYSERLKKIGQIDYKQDNKMIVKKQRKKLMRLENETIKNQKQILRLCIELLEYAQEYEKQEYLTKIQTLSIGKNNKENIIYQIERLFKKVDNKIIKYSQQEYHQIIKIINIKKQQLKYYYLKKLFDKLYNYQQYQKSIEIGQQLLKMDQALALDQTGTKLQFKKNQTIILITKKNIAQLYHKLVRLYYKIGKYQQSLKYSQNIVSILKKQYGEQHPNIASQYNQVSMIYNKMGKYQQALKYSLNSIKIWQKYYCQQHPSIAASYNQVSIIYNEMGKYQQALKYCQKSILIKKKYYGQQHPDIAVSYHQMRKYQLVLRYSLISIQIWKKYYGQQHPDIAATFHQISRNYYKMQNYQQALIYSQKSIKIWKKYYGQYHPNIASSYHQLSMIYNNIGRYKQALSHSQKSILINEKYYRQGHPDIAATYHQISLIYYKMKQYQQAIKYSQKSLQIKKKCYGQQHPDIAKTYHQISMIYYKMRKYQLAIKYSQYSIRIQKNYYGQQHPNIISSYQQISVIWKKYQSLKYQQNSILIQNKYQDLDIAIQYHQKSIIYLQMKKYQQALDSSQNCIQIYKKSQNQYYLGIATEYHQVSLIYFQMKKYQQALKYSKNCIQIYQTYKYQNIDLGTEYHQVSSIYLKMHKFQQALNYSQNCIQIYKNYYDQQHPVMKAQFDHFLIITELMEKQQQMILAQPK